MKEHVIFQDLPIPDDLGTVKYRPTPETVKKFAYGVEDETGWFLGEPEDGLAHPVFLANYLWWPEGYYIQESDVIGHWDAFMKKYPKIADPKLWLHSKTEGEFYQPHQIDKALIAKVRLIGKEEKRGKQFIEIEAMFTDEDGRKIARFVHGVMVKSSVQLRSGGVK